MNEGMISNDWFFSVASKLNRIKIFFFTFIVSEIRIDNPGNLLLLLPLSDNKVAQIAWSKYFPES